MVTLDHEGDAAFVFFPHLAFGRRLLLQSYRVRNRYLCWLDENPSLDLLMSRLHQLFERTGGVPHCLLVRAVRPLGSCLKATQRPRWNRSFARFCAHYGCTPGLLEPRVCSLRLWKRRLLECLDAADTLADGQRTLQALAHELTDADPAPQPPLGPLPGPFERHRERPCRVAADGFLRFEGDAYSVPWEHAGRTMWVRRHGEDVVIATADGEPLARHHSGDGHGHLRLQLSHFDTVRFTTLCRSRPLLANCQALFPEDQDFFSRLLAQRKLGAAETLRTILELTRTYRRFTLREAFRVCLEYNNFSHRFLQGLLECGDDLDQPQPPPVPKLQGQLF